MLHTFSLEDGWRLVGRAWVCVAFDMQLTPLATSATGLSVLWFNATCSPDCVSAAVSTVGRKHKAKQVIVNIMAVNRSIDGGNIWKTKMSVTSNREGTVVFSVYDEAVHVQGDRRWRGVGGIVPGTVILQQDATDVCVGK